MTFECQYRAGSGEAPGLHAVADARVSCKPRILSQICQKLLHLAIGCGRLDFYSIHDLKEAKTFYGSLLNSDLIKPQTQHFAHAYSPQALFFQNATQRIAERNATT
jgi:hypothetical protein